MRSISTRRSPIDGLARHPESGHTDRSHPVIMTRLVRASLQHFSVLGCTKEPQHHAIFPCNTSVLSSEMFVSSLSTQETGAVARDQKQRGPFASVELTVRPRSRRPQQPKPLKARFRPGGPGENTACWRVKGVKYRYLVALQPKSKGTPTYQRWPPTY